MFDSHVHYDHESFHNDRNELLEKMHETGLNYCLNAAIGFDTNEKMMGVFEKYPWIYYAIGIHPNTVEINEEKDEQYKEKLLMWAQNEKVKAIGETGLDYFRLEQSGENALLIDIEKRRKRQKKWFRISLEIAEESGLPVVLHVRGDAHKDALQILDACRYDGMRGVIHCFNGSYDVANAYVERGFKIGIGGMITREGMEETREAVRKIPLKEILLETDSPFVRPVGMEGKRNTSESLKVICETVAKIKGVSEKDVEDVTEENAKRMFEISAQE